MTDNLTFRLTSSRRAIFPLLLILMLIQLLPAPARAGSSSVSSPVSDFSGAQITDYRVIRSVARDGQGKVRLAIRKFNSDGVAHLLVVDPVTFQSYDLPASGFSLSSAAVDAALGSTPLMKAIERYDSAPYPLQNGGASRAGVAVAGSFLTVDLCPSKRPFERELFQTLTQTAKRAPVPVAVAVSGVWLVNHPEELAYLKRESAEGRLAITWVNHSYHHTYDPKAPLARNFLLTPGTDFTGEVLELEQLLLSRGLVPSPFFRFPGLVSDAATVKRLREFSLIPIGSDAWLAKGESPQSGSFILVHGNGNEPKGIKLLLPMLKNGELHLLPLPEAFGR
jgi:hypothetical protein